jgi:hypothetical protein
MTQERAKEKKKEKKKKLSFILRTLRPYQQWRLQQLTYLYDQQRFLKEADWTFTLT